jgi:uncharacterized protein DUF1844
VKIQVDVQGERPLYNEGMEESSAPKPEETAEEVTEAPAPAQEEATTEATAEPAPEEATAEAAAEPESEDPPIDMPLPPASFEFLVFSLRSQAEMHLGLMNFGDEKPTLNLPLAKHAIDMMGMLVEKTKGNLSIEESRLLENSVTELRYRFVQAADAAKKG